MGSKQTNVKLLDPEIEAIANKLGNYKKQIKGRLFLITGGLGFLGQYLGLSLLRFNQKWPANACQIVLLDNQIVPHEIKLNQKAQCEMINHDVRKPFSIKKPVDYILHAAGIASPGFYKRYPLEALEVSSLGTKNMLELAREHKARFLFFSSSEIYGNPDPEFIPTKEDYKGYVASMGPRACYDEGKRYGETLSFIYHEFFKQECMIVRPFNVFGPGMELEDQRVLPNFAKQIITGKKLWLYGDGNQTRTFCYVSDAIIGFFQTLFLGQSGQAYNIGNPTPEISIKDLIFRIGDTLNTNLLFELIENPKDYPKDEPLRRCPSIQKAKEHLGYQPEVDLNQGIKRYFDWIFAHYSKKVSTHFQKQEPNHSCATTVNQLAG